MLSLKGLFINSTLLSLVPEKIKARGKRPAYLSMVFHVDLISVSYVPFVESVRKPFLKLQGMPAGTGTVGSPKNCIFLKV